MNRRFLLLINSPALLLGLFLVGGCGVTLWAINSLQDRILRSFQYKVECLRAAHEMEVAVLKMRTHTLVNALQPTRARQRPIEIDHEEFEVALARAKKLAPPDQAPLMAEIESGYEQYRAQLTNLQKLEPRELAADLPYWADHHPVQRVLKPCEQLLEANQALMEHALIDSEAGSRELQLTLLILGTLGPAVGLFCGFSIARSISRSFARLQVRVQDVHSQVAPEVAVVDLKPGLDSLDDQLQFIVKRVQTLVENMQKQQRTLVRTEQLAMVGQLASSVAHEIRNPLTAMKWLVDAALRSYPADPMPCEDLRVLQQEIERMARTVQGVLDFARPARPQRSWCDLREIVQQAVELVRARKRQMGISCQLRLPEDAVKIEVDAAQIKSVLVNLFLNALDAMPRGGRLDITLSEDEHEVAIVVQDTGSGLSPDMLDKLFEPFNSTKPTGTGLGLSVAKRFIEDHGGRIEAANGAEGGARFTVTLPCSHETNLAEMCHAES